MIMCVLLCYPVSIRIYYQQGGLFLVVSIVSVQRSGFLSIYDVLSRFASVQHQHLLAVLKDLDMHEISLNNGGRKQLARKWLETI